MHVVINNDTYHRTGSTIRNTAFKRLKEGMGSDVAYWDSLGPEGTRAQVEVIRMKINRLLWLVEAAKEVDI